MAIAQSSLCDYLKQEKKRIYSPPEIVSACGAEVKHLIIDNNKQVATFLCDGRRERRFYLGLCLRVSVISVSFKTAFSIHFR